MNIRRFAVNLSTKLTPPNCKPNRRKLKILLLIIKESRLKAGFFILRNLLSQNLLHTFFQLFPSQAFTYNSIILIQYKQHWNTMNLVNIRDYAIPTFQIRHMQPRQSISFNSFTPSINFDI